MFTSIVKLLNSRKFAVYVFTVFVLMLILSTFLPSYYTLSERNWYELERNKPAFFWIASHFSTPFLVNSPIFLIISLFLFLSTLVCTITRLNNWLRQREYEFSKEKAFSFSIEETSSNAIEDVRGKIERLLNKARWEISHEQEGDIRIVSGQKGMSGFWGSIVFHTGLVVCFLAGPVTVFTHFRGELVITEDVNVPVRMGFASHVGKDPSTLPDLHVRMHDFKADYFEGKYKHDFKGVLSVVDSLNQRDIQFAVNKPINYMGYQFTLHEYGYSPQIVIEKEGNMIFDYYLNLRHPEEGDYFEIGREGLVALVMFFPDFFQEGNKIGSRSKMPDNPVTMIKLFKGNNEAFKGLFKIGDEKIFEGYRIKVTDYKHWVNLIVVREAGIVFVMIGSLIGITGLLIRFLSNERRLEFELSPLSNGTKIMVRGYSRYYPAFLEREVIRMAEGINPENADIAQKFL